MKRPPPWNPWGLIAATSNKLVENWLSYAELLDDEDGEMITRLLERLSGIETIAARIRCRAQ